MKKYIYPAGLFIVFIFLVLQLVPVSLKGQANINFELGNFTGWTGTWGPGTFCFTAPVPAPTANAGFNQGPNNSTPGSMPKFYQFITTGGLDSQLLAYGYNCPVVWPGGGSYSARIGTTHAYGEGESISYQFVVTTANCNFTYHYAVSLGNGTGGHLTEATQPYFDITMTDITTNSAITCAGYSVDGLSAASIAGFIDIPASVTGNGDAVYYKPWSSVFVPLNAYIGQTVKITFTTAACSPFCGGSHWAYAYIDADCSPLTLVASSPAICGGNTITLTAPVGAATYAWTGPGVIPPANNQTVSVNQAGVYSVTMTTFGTNPCTFTIDTTITSSPGNPVANFSAPAVCLGGPTTFNDLSTPNGSITGWTWDFGDGSTAAIAQNPSHTYATAGTYPVKLTISWPPCQADTIINVTVNPVPTSTFTATGPVCEATASSINYTGNGIAGDTYNWNFNNGTVVSGSGQGPYQVSWNSGGTKYVTLTVSAGGCTSVIDTQQVVVNPFPGVTISPNASVCTGASTTLTASGANSYTWAPATGLNITTGATVIATPAVTTTYTVTGVSSNCTSPATVTVTVNPIPTSTFTAVSPVCAGQNSTITYTGNATAGATYNWGFSGGTVTSGTGAGPYQVNWATSGSQNVTLSVTENGCTSTNTAHPVTVNPTPSSAFTATTPVCTGQNSTVTYSGVPSGTATYTWVFNGGTVVSGTGAGPYQVNWPTAGTKVVTLSVSDNGCTSLPDSQLVTVNAYPVATFTATSPVCAFQNATITFTGTASVNATYHWNFSGATLISGTGVGPYQVNWPTAGTQNVTLSVTDNGCTSTLTTVPVTVNATPSAVFTTNTPICTGQTSNITYTGTGTVAGNYVWSFDGGTIVSGAGQGPYVIGWSTAGSKNVTLSVTENGCTSPVADSIVVVNQTPVAAFTVVPSPLCVGQNTTITFTGTTDNAAVYSWNFSGATIVAGTAGSAGPYQIHWLTAGTQNISLSITDNACVSNDTIVPVMVNPVPVSNAGGPSVAFCSGDSAALGTAATNGYTYSWSPATGLSNPSISNPYADGTNNTSATIVIHYVVTTSAAGCSSTDAVVDSIYPLAVASFTPPSGACLGSSFGFQAGGSFLPSATFNWNFGTNGVPPSSSTQNQTVTFSPPGLQTVSLTITQLGCASSTSTQTVDVYPIPVAAFTPDTIFGCQNLQVCFFNNSLSNNPSTYQWSFGDGQNSSLQNPCNIYATPGVYTVELKIQSADGCMSNITMANLITISANPTAAFEPVNATIQLPANTISLSNQSLNSTSYLWNLGVLGSSTVTSPSLTFSLPGSYPVVLKAYNAQGCVDTIIGNIVVLPPTAFFIPNVFTPNGDGHNDEFYIEAQEGVTVYKFEVFDRWGEKVHDGPYPWDGTYRGKPCPQGVYVYMVQIVLAGQENGNIRKGSVTLMR